MLRPQLLLRAARAAPRVTAPQVSQLIFRAQLSTTPRRREKEDEVVGPEDPIYHGTTRGEPGASGDHEGQYARTDESITVEYPEEEDLPRGVPLQGRGGPHFKRTLASFSLEGKTAIVTGGARGLGLVMAQALAESGADVALVDLNKEEGQRSADEMTETLRKEADYSTQWVPGDARQKRREKTRQANVSFSIPKISAHFCDVSSPTSVSDCIKAVVKTHGKVDVLVTSAGFTENYEAINYPYDRMQKLWAVNVDGTYLFATGVAKHLMERKAPGSIVFIGSMSGAIVNVPQPQAPYNAAKAAVRHLAASLAVEWAGQGIRVNNISPGYMLTALTKKILDDNPTLAKQWTSLIPVGKMGVPEDLMGAVTFLASDASLYVTGADLRVDGGYTIT